MIKNIFLTGATGFIGSHLAERLLELDYNIIMVYKYSSELWRVKDLIEKNSGSGKVKSYDLNETSIEEIFDGNRIDCVIHLATYYKREHTAEDIDKFAEVIIRLPVGILESMVKHNVKFFINTGTFFEYKGSRKKLSEDSEKEAYDLYASFKASFSEILRYYSKNKGIIAADLKLFAPYGPKDNEKLVVHMIKNMISGARFEISKGSLQWDWTYVKDIAEAFAKTVKFLEKRSKGYEVFNIGGSSAYKIKDMVRILEKVSGKKALVSYPKKNMKDTMLYVNCDNSKAKKLLKWAPKRSIEEGLEETYLYYARSFPK